MISPDLFLYSVYFTRFPGVLQGNAGIIPAIPPVLIWELKCGEISGKIVVFNSLKKSVNCNLKRRALHPNACSAGLSSLHSWAPLGSFLHATIGWEITFTAQKRYRAPPQESRMTHMSVRHCSRALPAKKRKRQRGYPIRQHHNSFRERHGLGHAVSSFCRS